MEQNKNNGKEHTSLRPAAWNKALRSSPAWPLIRSAAASSAHEVAVGTAAGSSARARAASARLERESTRRTKH